MFNLIVRKLGVPIVVTFFLLVRFLKKGDSKSKILLKFMISLIIWIILFETLWYIFFD